MTLDFQRLNFILYLIKKQILGVKDLYFQIKKATLTKLELVSKKNKINVEFRYYSKQRPPHSSSGTY